MGLGIADPVKIQDAGRNTRKAPRCLWQHKSATDGATPRKEKLGARSMRARSASAVKNTTGLLKVGLRGSEQH